MGRMTQRVPHLSRSIATTVWPSPVGQLLIAASPTHLCGIWFQDQNGIPAWAQQGTPNTDHDVIRRAIIQLDGYFRGERQVFDLPLDLSSGTVFQQAVWNALPAIGYGETTSYLRIAQAIGRPKAVRAVGGAVGRNPLGIVLPCHRVLGSKGALTGYTGGLERKVALLTLEQRRGQP